MKSIVALALLFFINFGHAYVTGIYDIWNPETDDDNYLILATDGRVLEAPRDDSHLVDKLRAAKEAKLFVEVDILEDETSKDILQKRAVLRDITLMSKYYTLEEHFPDAAIPTEDKEAVKSLSSMSQANYYFRKMRTDTRNGSQCYNRAHVWAYELWKYHGLTTRKNWMFFTRRYIREYNYYWWFHVTPYVYVNGQGTVALDRTFMREATHIVPWKNYFMRNDAACPLLSQYSYNYYRNNQEAAYCYWIRTNMYFWQPYQIENLAEGADVRYGWKNSEINIAYGDAL